MRTFSEQIARIRLKKAETLLGDVAAQEMVTHALEQYILGKRNDRQIRFDLEKIVRDAYRESARGAQDAARYQAGLGLRWAPVTKLLVTPTLRRLISDVRRNLAEFKESDRDESAFRKAVLRFRLSATTAAQAGFSDGQQIAFTDIRDSGTEVRKMWAANWDHGNQPCTRCVDLHGVEVGLDEQFPVPGGGETYTALYAPPLHPLCRCDGIYLVVENGNRDDKVDLGDPSEPKMIDSTTIKNMPLSVFRAVIGALGRALDLLRKAVGL